ncbi:flavodoxin domain-containing protein [Peptostreptococcus equinus]|uniref:Flavodoxin n=1 Tax=Peptostreptococcus equinus TaxID=3003601 RepID=A0ABY7JPY0_9FIRM|nr:flavodoxin domain-containing protein [Peptostreptococcus sp. CBA3647]WAW14551.1 flavodoxin [Peptostreptococcus sp. CBA3647]
MYKGIIIYKSKYGASKKYANWIAEETNLKVKEIEDVTVFDIEKNDIIILVGGVYASVFACYSFMKKHIDVLRFKKLAIFCVGAADSDDSYKDALMDDSNILKIGEFFYGRGSMDIKNMTFRDKTIMKLVRKALLRKKKHEDLSIDEGKLNADDMLDMIDNSSDWTDKSYIVPLVSWFNENNK